MASGYDMTVRTVVLLEGNKDAGERAGGSPVGYCVSLGSHY